MDPRKRITSVILKTVLGLKQNQKRTKLSSLIIFMFIYGIGRKYKNSRVFLGRVPEVKTSAILCALNWVISKLCLQRSHSEHHIKASGNSRAVRRHLKLKPD